MILGIDPGLTGGVAFIDTTGRLVSAGPMPLQGGQVDGHQIARLIDVLAPSYAFVEQVHGRPRQAGVFGFGFSTGVIHGVLMAAGVPITLVAPQTWKGHFGIRRSVDETKAEKKTEARELATRLFPNHAHAFRRVRDDGAAEATLIALYGLKLCVPNLYS